MRHARRTLSLTRQSFTRAGRRRSALQLLVLLATLASGCMITPGDGARVASTTDSISFSGYVLDNGDTVTLRAFNFGANAWETVATTTSGPASVTRWTRVWYSWRINAILPVRFWAAAPSGSGGSYARVKAINGTGRELVTFRAIDAFNCLLANGSSALEDMAVDCASHRSPEAYVYTNAYEHGAPGCGTAPTTAKDHYNVTEIPACKRADIGALIQQKIDHDFVVKHHDHMFIDHSAASGPNSFLKGHRAYLREMQNFLSVYGEKWLPTGKLPFWTPNTTIPSGLTTIAPNPANCLSPNPGCTGWLQGPHATLSPSIALPSGLTAANICAQNPNNVFFFNAVSGWHGQVHIVTGGSGTFSTFDSPAALIFWPWHKYVDDLYAQWQACGFPDP
jgi:Common central domain of tyrosinase